MSPNRRIFLNVVATYGRSLYALVIGLFTSRWVLMALGEVDFGLYGVVGGLTAFVLFFNNLMSTAVVRFYGVSVGAAHVAETVDEGIEDCRRWFSIAFLLHTVVPLILIVIGYPIGSWAVHNFLTIPADRIASCIWVWRFTCLSCLISMLNVPFQAMYTAKQEIAELTIYSFARTTLNVCILYYMVSHPADWLSRYAGLMALLGIVPQVIIGIRAFIKYPECRLNLKYTGDISRIKQLLFYAGARFWTALAGVFASQGKNILVNKYLGPSFNASMTVGTQVTSQSSTLSSAISGAFWPAIANTAGEGDVEKVKSLCYRVCRLSTLMVLVFFIPLSLEIDKVLHLWLKNPPVFASELCIAIMYGAVCERITEGYWMAVMGIGKRVGYYSWIVGWGGFSSFVIAFVLLACGMGMWGIWLAIILGSTVAVVLRLYLGHVIVNFSTRYWLNNVLMPIVLLVMLATAAGIPSRLLLQSSFLRICITTVCCNVVFMCVAWAWVLSVPEKQSILQKISSIKKKIL